MFFPSQRASISSSQTALLSSMLRISGTLLNGGLARALVEVRPDLGGHIRHGAQAPSLETWERVSPPTTLAGLIRELQRQFPNMAIRATGGVRTVRRQAELMAERRLSNRAQFLRVYRQAQHISEMDAWVVQHPRATQSQIADAFEQIIHQARKRGATVSNHLDDRARDISIPHGNFHQQAEVQRALQSWGAHVILEGDATGGPHWHVDYAPPIGRRP
ncbi:hypothetical protein [Mesorhizobium sp. B2-6-5]|uniref:hypothetical protein n=1 Tax=Mesorhizobium sp. B2-6-5 TaxID=2589912 RepID=UPI00112E7A7E|nr:hypothetical protein [Mesorhizobium sp. B2-6-5]TPJ41391.1 hypothetical protein FJ432_12545 [Mesorhizobium sp. B2-6-5]